MQGASLKGREALCCFSDSGGGAYVSMRGETEALGEAFSSLLSPDPSPAKPSDFGNEEGKGGRTSLHCGSRKDSVGKFSSWDCPSQQSEARGWWRKLKSGMTHCLLTSNL